MKIYNFEFVTLHVSWKRILETLAAVHYCSLFCLSPFYSVIIPIYMFFYTQYWWMIVLYFLWFWYDFKTPQQGGRRVQWFRNMKIWQYLRDYFPIKLEKTCDLDPKNNYIFAFHPHGILGCGMFVNFATDVSGFPELFPGIKIHPLTLVGQFWFPFRRDFILLSGGCDVSRESLRYLLTQEDKGHAVSIVIGGAAEALLANPNGFNLILEPRRGFIKTALSHGAHLVPVFSFGENDVYDQIEYPPGSLVRRLQLKMKKHCGFAFPIFNGRGIWNYTFGCLCRRGPITTVVGKPIPVEKFTNPTQEQIEDLHKKYKKGLSELFESNKRRFGIREDVHLNFL